MHRARHHTRTHADTPPAIVPVAQRKRQSCGNRTKFVRSRHAEAWLSIRATRGWEGGEDEQYGGHPAALSIRTASAAAAVLILRVGAPALASRSVTTAKASGPRRSWLRFLCRSLRCIRSAPLGSTASDTISVTTRTGNHAARTSDALRRLAGCAAVQYLVRASGFQRRCS